MKYLCPLFVAIILSVCSYAQTITNDNTTWEILNSNIFRLNGKVGIGTNNPQDKLEINDSDTDSDGNIQDGVVTIKNNNYSRFRTESYSNTFFRNGQIQGIRGRGTYNNPEDVIPGDRVFGTYAHIIENRQLNPSPIGSIEFYVGSEVASGEIRFATLSPNEEMRNDRMIVDQYGNIGIGTMKPKSKLHVADGDIFIEDISKGIVMKSPNGQCWRGQVNDHGELHFTVIDCSEVNQNSKSDFVSVKIDIYPNPTNKLLKIKVQNRDNNIYSYKIFNIVGDIQDQGMINSDIHEIKINHLSAAPYIISFFDENGIPLLSKKFIKE